MKVIYHCYGGTHSSVLAAAIHLGLLKSKKKISAEELFACPLFDRLKPSQIGTINWMGEDSHGNEIFVMGCKNAGYLVEKVLFEFCRVLNVETNNILLVSTIPCLNIPLRIGGYLSRRFNLVTLGRFFLLIGARRAMNKINSTVCQVKEKLLKNREETRKEYT